MSNTSKDRAAGLRRRTRQARTLLQTEGMRGLTARTLSAASRRIERPRLVLEVRDQDVLAADLGRPPTWISTPVPADQPMTINWVFTPPAPGSGGHTTAFRLIRFLQSQGHTCRVYLYDVFGADFTHFQDIVHNHFADPSTHVANVLDGMADADAVVATAWETAYPVYNSTARGKRFYLVQDHEPWHYPASAAGVLAANTYRMGFHGITAGGWLSQLLPERYGMPADAFEFGSDLDCYRPLGHARNGVIFYARPEAPRRAFELGVMALELFHSMHPEIRIHFYGNQIRSMPFPFVDHGHVTPARLNELYNECFAGLSFSMTNVSLVPHEMLAAGCIPVVNEAEHNRIVLSNDHVRYVDPNPRAMADSLSAIVTASDFPQMSKDAAASVQSRSWEDAGRVVEEIFRRELSPAVAAAI